MRIVSLIASSTEIICALGFKNQMVGRSHECDFPPSVRELPICTEVKFQTDGSSYEIDQRVKAILQEGLSVYKVKADRLQELKPDVIVTQIQCEVCAVSEKDVMEAVCQLVDSKPKIVSLNPNALADIFSDIQKVADALEAPERGRQLIKQLQNRMKKIQKGVSNGFHEADSGSGGPLMRSSGRGRPELKRSEIPEGFPAGGPMRSPRERQASESHWKHPEKPTVACIEWMDPLMAGGNWLPELVDLAGGINLFGKAGKHSPWMTWEEVLQKDPDIIIILPCGFDIKRTREEAHLMSERPGWNRLKAVENKCVYVADGNQYFNRPGPRVVESLEILAEIFHPDAFNFGHKGIGWEYF